MSGFAFSHSSHFSPLSLFVIFECHINIWMSCTQHLLLERATCNTVLRNALKGVCFFLIAPCLWPQVLQECLPSHSELLDLIEWPLVGAVGLLHLIICPKVHRWRFQLPLRLATALLGEHGHLSSVVVSPEYKFTFNNSAYWLMDIYWMAKKCVRAFTFVRVRVCVHVKKDSHLRESGIR